jgi:TolB-like protein/DNA-binding winged helix-turn-helix (wHTH) protein
MPIRRTAPLDSPHGWSCTLSHFCKYDTSHSASHPWITDERGGNVPIRDLGDPEAHPIGGFKTRAPDEPGSASWARPASIAHVSPHPDLGQRVVLSREAAFHLGSTRVKPTSCEVLTRDAAVRLQPRVMQVLVAMARAQGEAVTREALVASCWGGIAISDDALSRCIQRLRRLSEVVGSGTLAIETIPRVGYRLRALAPSAVAPLSIATAGWGAPLLAVLLFDNLSHDADVIHFSDGVSEEILQTVARGATIRVIGRSSSFNLRGGDKAAKRVGEALCATHVVDGAVRRAGSGLRITTHLIECASETTLWSARFDGDISDVFNMQDQIAVAVAGALKTILRDSALPVEQHPLVTDVDAAFRLDFCAEADLPYDCKVEAARLAGVHT